MTNYLLSDKEIRKVNPDECCCGMQACRDIAKAQAAKFKDHKSPSEVQSMIDEAVKNALMDYRRLLRRYNVMIIGDKGIGKAKNEFLKKYGIEELKPTDGQQQFYTLLKGDWQSLKTEGQE